MQDVKFKRSVFGGWLFGLAKLTVYVVTLGSVSLGEKQTDNDGWIHIDSSEVSRHGIKHGQKLTVTQK